MAVGAFGGGVAGSRCLAPRAEACYRRFFRWWWGLGDEGKKRSLTSGPGPGREG